MTHVLRFRADLARLCNPDRVRLLVAVSGGPDSLALLLLAHAALGERCLAATVDHGLRPGSRSEAEHVAAICAARGIRHAILHAPLSDRAGRTANLSARARALRYGLLEAHADATGCDLIATGHHTDDQLETMVMRLNRGAGLGGLAGTRARNGRVIRPLLGWRRAELAQIVAAAGLNAVEDPSNTDPRFDRARVRVALAGADWLDPEGWAKSSAALDDADVALRWAAARLLEERVASTDTSLELDLTEVPVELARRLVLACLDRLQPGLAVRGDNVMRLVTGAESVFTFGELAITRLRDGLLRFAPAPPRRPVD